MMERAKPPDLSSTDDSNSGGPRAGGTLEARYLAFLETIAQVDEMHLASRRARSSRPRHVLTEHVMREKATHMVISKRKRD